MSLTIALIAAPTDDQISSEIELLLSEVRLRKSEINVLSNAITHYRQLCKHPGQVSGWNERDGDWSSSCPVCGHSR